MAEKRVQAARRAMPSQPRKAGGKAAAKTAGKPPASKPAKSRNKGDGATPPPAEQKRRSRKSPFDRKQELLQATIDVLAQQGQSGLTLASVAKRAGVSTALIIVHFKSKENLLLEVLRRMGTDYFGALHASQVGAGDRPADRLWHLVQAEFDPRFFTPRHLAAWKTFWSETNGRRAYIELFGAQTQHFLQLTIDLCKLIIKEGGYQDYDPKIVARLIDTTLGGLWIDLTVTATPITIDEARHVATSQLALFFPRHFTHRGPR
jgi:TetR/AcrR family transcriptional repressor of bet genes